MSLPERSEKRSKTQTMSWREVNELLIMGLDAIEVMHDRLVEAADGDVCAAGESGKCSDRHHSITHELRDIATTIKVMQSLYDLLSKKRPNDLNLSNDHGLMLLLEKTEALLAEAHTIMAQARGVHAFN